MNQIDRLMLFAASFIFGGAVELFFA